MAPPTMSLQTLSAIRLLLGASCLAIPSLTSKFFRLTPVTGASILFIRIVGARELILGTLLWTANTSSQRRQSILASLVADSVDILSIGVGLLEGSLEQSAAPVGAVGALVGVVLGLVGLRSLGEKENRKMEKN